MAEGADLFYHRAPNSNFIDHPILIVKPHVLAPVAIFFPHISYNIEESGIFPFSLHTQDRDHAETWLYVFLHRQGS